MDAYELTKNITALADGEINDERLQDEIMQYLSEDKKLRFEYDVQNIVGTAVRDTIIKHPVPFNLNKKINQILSFKKEE